MRLFIASAAALLFIGLAAPVFAGEGGVGGALVEVLHQKGVIDDASYDELKKAEGEGGEQALDRKLIEVLHDKGVLDDASYSKLSGMTAKEKAAEVKTGETTAREAVKSVDKTLTSLEEGIARLGGDTVKMKIGMFFQGGWLNDDAGFSVPAPPTTGRTTSSGNQFFVRRARLFFDGTILDKVGFKVSTEVSDTNGKVLRDAYVYADYIPYARVTLGQHKQPFGVEGVEALALNPTINRSFATNHMHAIMGSANTTLRDLGVSLSGKYQTKVSGLPFGAGYAVGLFNGTGQNTTDDNDAKDVVGRAWINPMVAGLTVGGSWYVGKSHSANGFETDHDKWAADVDYNPPFVKGLKVRGEAMWERRFFDTYASKNITSTSAPLPALGRHAHAFGWYALAAYKVDGLKGYLKYLNGFEPVVRYDYLDEDLAVSDDSRDRTTLGLNYYLAKDTRLMVNYEIIHADGKLKTKSLETIDTIGHHLLTTIFQVKF